MGVGRSQHKRVFHTNEFTLYRSFPETLSPSYYGLLNIHDGVRRHLSCLLRSRDPVAKRSREWRNWRNVWWWRWFLRWNRGSIDTRPRTNGEREAYGVRKGTVSVCVSRIKESPDVTPFVLCPKRVDEVLKGVSYHWSVTNGETIMTGVMSRVTEVLPPNHQFVYTQPQCV